MPTLYDSTLAWQMWLDVKLPLGARAIAWENKSQVCANGTANWTEYAGCKGIDSAGGATFIGEDDWGIAYFHLTGGRTSWVKVAQEWACNGSTGQPYFNGVVLQGLEVNIYDGGSDTRPLDGAQVIPHSGYPVCAALEWEGTGGGWLVFVAGDSPDLSLASCMAALGLVDRSLKVGITLS